MFNDVTFAYPYLLYLLLLIPLILFWYWRRNKKISPDITFSSLSIFDELKPTLKERLRHIPILLRTVALGLLIIALARPQTFSTGENVYTEGIDIAVLLDISGSMLAEDFKPNRLEAAKDVIDNFIEGRTTDKIGLVIFAKESFTQCPLTIDYSVLRNLIGDIQSGMIEDGTAIGTAIANGVNRLKDSKAKSKVIILLTDGVNNSGEIDPITAAQIAEKFGIRIYTVGVGTRGEAPYPFNTPFGKRYQNVPVEIDEATLQQVADITSGKYFRATDNQKLEQIYEQIDKLEKTRVEITSYRQAKELFYNWIGAGLILLIFEFGLLRTYLNRLP
ncbi:MAG: VWA domain-containing protein [Melioribacteraceae bacterium]|nr:VWA domain-containing protein [Melioribacteraceae bacterium]MCF8355122.1 VWA domain-containing protein [Melioribacteraceae bacterium]MCF8392401.1 VWA domain-containing protein [Melioribacteraceae bacterium]MCF8417922.1 VWA domain-containing protein [Melioribacteraceae bacterium]